MSDRDTSISVAAPLSVPMALSCENLQKQEEDLKRQQLKSPCVTEQGLRNLPQPTDIPFVGASYPQRRVSIQKSSRPETGEVPPSQPADGTSRRFQLPSIPSSTQISEASGSTPTTFTDAALKRVFLELIQSKDPAIQGAVGSALKSVLQQDVSDLPPATNATSQILPSVTSNQGHTGYQRQNKWKRETLSVIPGEAYPGLPTPPPSERAPSTVTLERSDCHRTMSLRSESVYRGDRGLSRKGSNCSLRGTRIVRPNSAIGHGRERLQPMGHIADSAIIDHSDAEDDWEDTEEYIHDRVADLPDLVPRHLVYPVRRAVSQRRSAEALHSHSAWQNAQSSRLSMPPPSRHHMYDSTDHDTDRDNYLSSRYIPERNPLRPALPVNEHRTGSRSFGRVSTTRRPQVPAASRTHYRGGHTCEEDEEYDEYDDSGSAPIPDISRSPPPSRQSQSEKGNRTIGLISPKRSPPKGHERPDPPLSDIASQSSCPNTARIRHSRSTSYLQQSQDNAKGRSLPSGGRTRHRVKENTSRQSIAISESVSPSATRKSSIVSANTDVTNATSIFPTSLLPSSLSIASKHKYKEDSVDHLDHSNHRDENDPFQPDANSRPEKCITLTPEWILPSSKNNSSNNHRRLNTMGTSRPTTGSSSNHRSTPSRSGKITTPTIGASVNVVFEQGNITRTFVENGSPKSMGAGPAMSRPSRAGGGGRGGGGVKVSVKKDTESQRRDVNERPETAKGLGLGVGVFEMMDSKDGKKAHAGGGGGVKKFWGRIVGARS